MSQPQGIPIISQPTTPPSFDSDGRVLHGGPVTPTSAAETNEAVLNLMLNSSVFRTPIGQRPSHFSTPRQPTSHSSSTDSESTSDVEDTVVNTVSEENRKRGRIMLSPDDISGATSAHSQVTKKGKLSVETRGDENSLVRNQSLEQIKRASDSDKLTFLVESLHNLSVANERHFNQIDNRLDQIENSIKSEVNKAVDLALSEKMDEIDERVKARVNEGLEAHCKMVERQVTEVRSEMIAKHYKMKNFILYEIPELDQEGAQESDIKEYDKAKIADSLGLLGIKVSRGNGRESDTSIMIKSSKRIGDKIRKNEDGSTLLSKHRPLRVVTDSAGSCDLVFDKYQKVDKKQVSVKLAKDRTRKENEEYRSLQAEAKRRANAGEGDYVIRNMKLVKLPFRKGPCQ